MSSYEKVEIIDVCEVFMIVFTILCKIEVAWVVRTCMLSVDASHSCFAHMHCTERLKRGEINSSAGNDTLVWGPAASLRRREI